MQWALPKVVFLSLLAGVAVGQTPVDSTKVDSTSVDSVKADSVAPAPAPALPGNLRLVGGDLRFTSISVGGAHVCGLTAEGKAYCWGRNRDGQLGDSTTTDRAEPVAVSAGVVFKLVSAGGRHTCGISRDNQPYCWGNNEHGQLGNCTTRTVIYPFLVAGEHQMTLIVSGPNHTCGTLKHWEKEGMALCWGLNTEGQLGDMGTETSSLPLAPFGVIRYVSLALGDSHTCGATREGRVFCWGINLRGQLGNGSATESRVPFITRMNRKSDFTMVASGAAHTCALSGSGDVVCWGDNTEGQVGSGGKGGRILSPTSAREATGYAAIYATGNATCAQRKDGSVACWGSNANGLFGDTSLPSTRTPAPAPALAEAGLSGFSLGGKMGCGWRAGGPAVCWGQRGSPAAN